MIINDMQIIRTEENLTHIWDGECLIMTLSGVHHSRGTLTDIISAYQQGRDDAAIRVENHNGVFACSNCGAALKIEKAPA